MRKLILVGTLVAAPLLAHAAVITEQGTPGTGAQTYNGYQIIYSFGPIPTIPGQVTNVRLDFTGTVNPAIGGASNIDTATGSVINSVTVTPVVSFINSLLSGAYENGVPVPQTSAQGTRTMLGYDNSQNISYPAASEQSISLSASRAGVPSDYFATESYQDVVFFNDGRETTASLSGFAYFGNENTNRTSGYGNLLLTITYEPVPEPASMALLGTGLLGLMALQRRRHVNR